MRARALFPVAVAAIALSSLCAGARAPAPSDAIVVMYEFDQAPDGRPLHIRFAGTVRFTGFGDARNVRSDVLTGSEQTEGVRIISQRRYSRKKAKRGEKRRDGVLFDVRARKFVPQKT